MAVLIVLVLLSKAIGMRVKGTTPRWMQPDASGWWSDPCPGVRLRAMQPTATLPPLDAARHLLAWWGEAGVDVSHVTLAPPARPAAMARRETKAAFTAPATGAGTVPASAAVEAAQAAAAAATTLDALRAAIEGFEGCALKKTAKLTVFADGVAGADVMLVGEAPGGDEDRDGRPFVGKAGQLLDAMMKSIGLSRATNLYITNVVPWRPPGNRTPSRDELAICRPFVMRHIQLARPRYLLLAGGVAAQTVLGASDGITKLRQSHKHTLDPGDGNPPIPVRCLLHPAYLLRRPAEKALMWKDLLSFIDGL
jgi:uracil-DNA glycosylase